MADDVDLLGAVLCGGRSTRMGRDKAMLVDEQGVDFLSLSIDRLKPLCRQVCVSATSDRATAHRLIPDPSESFGPISGVESVLSVAAAEGFDGCLINPVDTPHLSSDDLRDLIVAYRHEPHKPVCAVSETDNRDDPRLQPLIAVYPVAGLPSLREWIESKQYSLRRYLESTSFSTIKLPDRACHNINTPADLDSK